MKCAGGAETRARGSRCPYQRPHFPRPLGTSHHSCPCPPGTPSVGSNGRGPSSGGQAGQLLHAALPGCTLAARHPIQLLGLSSPCLPGASPQPLLAAPAPPSPICALCSPSSRSHLTEPLPGLPDRVHSAGHSAGWAGPGCLCGPALTTSCCSRTALRLVLENTGSSAQPALMCALPNPSMKARTWLCGERAQGGLIAVTLPPPFLQDLTLLIPQAPAASLHQPLCDVLAPPGRPRGDSCLASPGLCSPRGQRPVHILCCLQQARAWTLKGSEPGTGRGWMGEAGKELVTER